MQSIYVIIFSIIAVVACNVLILLTIVFLSWLDLSRLSNKIKQAEKTGSLAKKVIAQSKFDKADQRWTMIISISCLVLGSVFMVEAFYGVVYLQYLFVNK